MQLQQFAHISIIQNHPNNKGDIYVYWILLKNIDFFHLQLPIEEVSYKICLKINAVVLNLWIKNNI